LAGNDRPVYHGGTTASATVQEQEFKSIYREYGRPLYGYVLWLTGSRAASDDILQTVFLRVWRGAAVPEEPAQRKAWLYTVCRNACLDHFRAASRGLRFRRQYALETQAPDPDARGDSLLWEMVEKLPETDRTVVHLHVRMGWSYAEVAEVLKTTENNVRVRAFRAFRKLRGAFTEKP